MVYKCSSLGKFGIFSAALTLILIVIIGSLIYKQRVQSNAKFEAEHGGPPQQLNDDQFEVACDDSFLKAWAHGANDVMVVKRKDGTFESTSWKAQVGTSYSWVQESRKGKLVTIFVDDVPAKIKMTICETGWMIFSRSENHNRMTDTELKELNLKLGRNHARYYVEDLDITVEFNVFLYNEDDKLVITDVDGTITESDVKGQLLPWFGVTAQHKAVVELFDKISKNGYHLVYLTARSMAMDVETRTYLFTMLQDLNTGFSIPPGPVILSPVTFLSGLFKEVVYKTPYIEKSKWIDEMNNIFVGDAIVGAYGNKDTDTKAYQNSGVPLERVWIVNPEGVLKNVGTEEETSYPDQAQNVDTLYPKIE